MKLKIKTIIPVLLVFGIASQGMPQDMRTLDTKIADLLAQFPAESNEALVTLGDEMLGLGEEGILMIGAMLDPFGNSDDTAARYALNGLTHYTAGMNNKTNQRMVVKTYIKALHQFENRETKAFFIRQLQSLGSDRSIPALCSYLDYPALVEPATQALIAIASPKGSKSILSALKTTENSAMAACYIKALGDLRYAGAAKTIAKFAESGEEKIRSSAFYALANIGHKSSYKVLAAMADATGRYGYLLQYAERRFEVRDAKTAAMICGPLLAPQLEPHTRSAALALIVSIMGNDSKDILIAAMDSPDKDYRGQALRLAKSERIGSTAQWVEKFRAVPENTGAEILSMLALRGDKAAWDILVEALKSDSDPLRKAAIPALFMAGGDRAFPYMLPVLKTENPEWIAAIEKSLLSYGSESTLDALARTLSGLPPSAQASLLRVLNQRGNRGHITPIMELARSSRDDNVRLEALRALKPIVNTTDIPKLLGLVQFAGSAGEETAVQEALVTAAAALPEAGRADPVIEAMESADNRSERILLGTLPALGGSKALDVIRSSLKDGEPETQLAAAASLSRWPEPAAMPDLKNLINTIEDDEARTQSIDGFVRLITKSGKDDSARLEAIQTIVPRAKTRKEKEILLQGLTSIRTEASLATAAKFLDGQAQLAAADAVVRIALPQSGVSQGLKGPETVRILKSIMPLMESRYTQEEIQKHLDRIAPKSGLNDDEGVFIPLFNGRDLTGWKGLVGNPVSRAKMSAAELAGAQAEADKHMREHWSVKEGVLVFDGKGGPLCTAKDYGDFEMLVDWKIGPEGDSGIYLRGSPQVQIWDPSQWPEGSGGLYNNQKNPSKPLVKADNPIGEWNTFRIRMIGDRVTVHLNGKLVVDNVVMENYWDRSLPIFDKGQIELQNHGNPLYFRNIYIREIPRESEYTRLFNGKDLQGWTGAVNAVKVEDGKIVYPKTSGGNIYTKEEYGDFILRFEFRLTPGANNGLGIRTPLEGDAAYVGMELQILDNTASIYKNLKPYQYHGSVYGVIPAKRGFLKPVGEWNFEEVIARGDHIIVNLNGETILNGNIRKAGTPKTMDGRKHPGLLNKKGHIGFLGHGSHLEFRNIYIKSLDKQIAQ